MPTLEFDFLRDDDLSFDPAKLVVLAPIGARLRKVDPQTGVAAVTDGEYELESDLILPERKMTGLQKLLGLELEAVQPAGTELLFQGSNDGGASYMYHDGLAWAPATLATQFNTLTDFDDNLETFPTGARRIRLKVKHKAKADRSIAPLLKRVFLHAELRYNWFEDVKRSLKRFLDAQFRPVMEVAQVTAAATSTIIVNTRFKVDAVLGVFNLTDDPGRTVNLFLSKLDIQTGVDEDQLPVVKTQVTMTASVPAGKIVEVQFSGKAEVFIGKADDDVQVARLPALVLTTPTGGRQGAVKPGKMHVERVIAKMKAFKRESHQMLLVPLTVRCLSDLEEASLAMLHELQRVLDGDGFRIFSEASAEELTILDFNAMGDADVTDTGLSVKEITCAVYGAFWSGPSVQLPLASEVRISVESPWRDDGVVVDP